MTTGQQRSWLCHVYRTARLTHSPAMTVKNQPVRSASGHSNGSAPLAVYHSIFLQLILHCSKGKRHTKMNR